MSLLLKTRQHSKESQSRAAISSQFLCSMSVTMYLCTPTLSFCSSHPHFLLLLPPSFPSSCSSHPHFLLLLPPSFPSAPPTLISFCSSHPHFLLLLPPSFPSSCSSHPHFLLLLPPSFPSAPPTLITPRAHAQQGVM